MRKGEKLRFLSDRLEDELVFMVEDVEFVFINGELYDNEEGFPSDLKLAQLLNADLALKPGWEFTEDEKVILRNLPEQYKWIVRDEHTNLLRVYEHIPSKYPEVSVWRFGGISYSLEPFKNLFQSIQWSDDEPCEFRKYL